MAKMESTGSIVNDDGERLFVLMGLSDDKYAEALRKLNEISLSRSQLEVIQETQPPALGKNRPLVE